MNAEQISAAKFLDETNKDDQDLPEEDRRCLEDMAKDNAGEIKTREEWQHLAMIYAELSE